MVLAVPQRSRLLPARVRSVAPCAAMALALVSLSSGRALAQAPAGVPGAENFAPSLRAADEGTPKPYADDERTGHVLVRGAAGLAAPAGSVAGDAAFGDVASAGAAFGGSLGVGLSRHAVLDLSASYALFGGAERCVDCTAESFSASLGLSYHLAQGVAIDPWIRLGSGFRSAELDSSSATSSSVAGSGSYLGLDVVQLAFGASFAPVAGVGFGPFIGLDLGTFLERPGRVSAAGEIVGTTGATYALFQLGMRFELDPRRWFGGDAPDADRSARSVAAAPSALPSAAALPAALARPPVQSAVVTRSREPL